MIRLLLDLLMQVVWSWIAFVDSALLQGQIRAGIFLGGFHICISPVFNGEDEKH